MMRRQGKEKKFCEWEEKNRNSTIARDEREGRRNVKEKRKQK